MSDHCEPDRASPRRRDRGVPSGRQWVGTIAIFLTGQTVSLFGSAMVSYAVFWYITLKTGSGWQYAVMYITASLATAATTVPGGVWADRFSRKALMVGSDALVAGFTMVLALVMFAGYEQLWLIVVVLCCRGLGSGVQSPAMMATIPSLVPPDKLLRVNSINSSIQSLTLIAAPALAAVLLAYLPLGWILMLDVMTAAIGIGCVLAIAVPRPVVDPNQAAPEGIKGYFQQMGEAARYGLGIPQLRRVAIMLIVMMVVVIPPANMTPVIIVRNFGSEQWKLALVEILWSVGMVVGGLVLAAWGGLKNRMTMMLIIADGWGLFTIGLGVSPNLWVFCLVMVVYGLSFPGFTTTALTSTQELIPPHLLGRTMGFINLIFTLAGPIGMAVIGPLADVVDIRLLAIVCGVIGLVFVGVLALDRGPASRLYAPTPLE